MNKEQQKYEIILMVKKAIANNCIPFEDSDEFVELDGFDVDNIADEVYETLYNAGYRKVPEYAVIIPSEEREEEIKATNEILAERDGLKAERERLKVENWRLTAKLRQVLLSIDTVKETNTMCNISKQIEQAVKEFAEKVKDYINDKVIADFDDSDSVKYYTVDLDEFESEIDELLKEYEVEE